SVSTLAIQNNTIFMGGDFTRMNPATGGGDPFDPTTGTPLPGFPRVLGEAYVITSDGAGGSDIGGRFDKVGGLPRSSVAHLAHDLSVTSWGPEVAGEVYVIAPTSTMVYLGGYFSSVGGSPRERIAAVDATTGAVIDWNPTGTEGLVFALAVSGSTVY